LARHFTQYACMFPPSLKLFAINNKPFLASMSSAVHAQIATKPIYIKNFYI